MRLPRVRFTVRRMMIAVAVVARSVRDRSPLGVAQLYLEKAADHAGFRALVLRSPETIAYWESRWTAQREGLPAKYPWPSGTPFVPAMARYYDAMRIKYEQAARYPWLPIAPDPPKP